MMAATAGDLVTLDAWIDADAAWEAGQASAEPLDASEWGFDGNVSGSGPTLAAIGSVR
jgi:hypothetical protein